MAQIPYRAYSDDGVELNFHEIQNVDFRIYLLYHLSQDHRFVLTAENENGQFVLTPAYEMDNFTDEFESFYEEVSYRFFLLSKTDIYDQINEWKSAVASDYFLSITLDIALRNTRVDNDHCIESLPFCTSDLIEFSAASTHNTAHEEDMNAGCLENAYNPSFYHMRIHDAGPFVIHMEGNDPNDGTNRDIDFCMWGPYTEQEVLSGYACTHLKRDKIMDCAFSTSNTEDCYLGYPQGQHQHSFSHGYVCYHEPQVNEYYILMITNYSQQPCVINFTKIEGEGETDCDILPSIVSNDGPFCVGETIELTAATIGGATFSWTGPGGFTSNQQNPSRPNCTMAMAGAYTCTITVGSQTHSASTVVEVLPRPEANFTMSQTTVCKGQLVDFTNTSTTYPAGDTLNYWAWDFGDGMISSSQNPTHFYTIAGTYMVTLTVGYALCNCTTTQTITVLNLNNQTFDVYEIACDEYVWNGITYDATGNYTQQFTSAQGCDSIVTLHLTISDIETEDFNVTECDAYTWHGTTYTESGTYTYETTTSEGCERIETLHLTVNHSETEDFTITASESYTWHGETYTQSGTYTYETTTAQGCPRTETLHLTITTAEYFIVSASAGPNGRIEPEGDVHVEPGGLISFTISPDPGCAISQVIIDGVEYAPIETVAFSNVHGDHTLQALFWGVGVDEQLNPMLRIYPNPAKDKLNIESPNMKRVSVFNLLGVQMGSMDVNGDCAVVGMDEFPQGIYILKVEYDNGRVGYSQFVVVR